MHEEKGLSAADELAELVADLSAWTDWARACGLRAVPPSPPFVPEPYIPEPRAPEARAPQRPAPAPQRAPVAPVVAASPTRPASDPTVQPQAPAPRAEVPSGSKWAAVLARPAEPTARDAAPSPAPAPVEPDPGKRLAAVREALGDCTRCRLCENRNKLVFGVGSPSARLLIVGEAPGAREDQLGEPFVGAAGEMLDRMLENVLHLSRSDVYILNVVKCRPPENRDPQPDEVAACRPFLEQQIDAIAPTVILAVGRIAAQTLLETTRGINALRGEWSLYRGRVPMMATFHPAYLLRKPEDKRKTMDDLLKVKERLGAPPPR